MLKPVNGHLLIEPITHEGFMASQKERYEEIGVVVAISNNINWVGDDSIPPLVKVSDKVFFDSWLAARYPKEGSKADEYYWLVKWKDVRAIESNGTIPE